MQSQLSTRKMRHYWILPVNSVQPISRNSYKHWKILIRDTLLRLWRANNVSNKIKSFIFRSSVRTNSLMWGILVTNTLVMYLACQQPQLSFIVPHFKRHCDVCINSLWHTGTLPRQELVANNLRMPHMLQKHWLRNFCKYLYRYKDFVFKSR